jgi:hypothetical protein
MRRPLQLSIVFSLFSSNFANIRLSVAALSAFTLPLSISYKMRSMGPGADNWAVTDHDGNGGRGVTLTPAEGGYSNVVSIQITFV